jgi:micrococcal nuclease
MMIFIRIAFILFLSFFLCGNMYFWVDESGIRHYTNVAPPTDGSAKEYAEVHRVFEKLTSSEKSHQKFKILKVFDGDTILVTAMDLVFSIRLVGIDSPEIGYGDQESQPFGQEAKAYLEDLLDNREVTLKNHGEDSYHRQLAEVFADGKNINIEMIKQGLAEVYHGDPPKTLDRSFYLKEEEKAKKAGKGIWRLGKSYKSPKQWRRENPRK